VASYAEVKIKEKVTNEEDIAKFVKEVLKNTIPRGILEVLVVGERKKCITVTTKFASVFFTEIHQRIFNSDREISSETVKKHLQALKDSSKRSSANLI
jgi:DNA-binding phage protein